MTKLYRPNTIYLNISLTLIFGLFSFTLLSMLLAFFFILSPMANRAATDMGGLIHIISQSWFALPAEKKPEFQSHLREQHQLMITDKNIPISDIKIKYPFIPKLEKVLRHHIGQQISVKQGIEDKRCLWIVIPGVNQAVTIGFYHDRIGPRPVTVMLGILASACILILITSILLVRRITKPIQTLSQAVNLLGSGNLSTRIPEAGAEELVVLARSFNQMAEEISQLLVNRSILFGGISHDLRTPITRLQIALELLEDDNDSDLISKMRNNLEQMENLIQQSLELVKGMDKYHAIDVEINAVIDSIVNGYQGQNICYKSIECGICNIEVNAFRRIVCNLLDNAFRYSSNKPVDLSCIKENKKLVIRILDQGKGIPLEKLEVVFQPFYRLDNSRNLKTGGSGLGLAIVKQLSEIHGWKIQLLPRFKGGLEAKLEIPLEA